MVFFFIYKQSLEYICNQWGFMRVYAEHTNTLTPCLNRWGLERPSRLQLQELLHTTKQWHNCSPHTAVMHRCNVYYYYVQIYSGSVSFIQYFYLFLSCSWALCRFFLFYYYEFPCQAAGNANFSRRSIKYLIFFSSFFSFLFFLFIRKEKNK